MNFHEEALLIECAHDRLIAIHHRPQSSTNRGVLIVVGGPQYRVGSHRQFLLLARYLASVGIPVLRFDYRGMGDSDGEQRGFEDVNDDIRTAIDAFFARQAGLEDIVIWGLCDAASAALMYASRDERVDGLVLLNPWVRSEATLAKTVLKHHYRSRLLDKNLWKRLLTGQINPFVALGGLMSTMRSATADAQSQGDRSSAAFVTRMREGLAAFQGRVLFVLSGDDMTAAEFEDEVRRSSSWRELLDRDTVQQVRFADANHTFSRREWRDQVANKTAEWVQSR